MFWHLHFLQFCKAIMNGLVASNPVSFVFEFFLLAGQKGKGMGISMAITI
jgi:hypothetical protein